jgi:hypothetical protein
VIKQGYYSYGTSFTSPQVCDTHHDQKGNGILSVQKMILVASVVGGCAIAVLFLISVLSACSNVVNQQLVSPDNQFKAVVFSRECGATTGSNTQISVIPANWSLPSEAGNLFTEDSHQGAASLNVTIKWLGARKLLIVHDSRAELYLHKDNVELWTFFGLFPSNRIAVVYEAIPMPLDKERQEETR